MYSLKKSFIKNVLYAKNKVIIASEAGHDITNMFSLLTKPALQLWFLERQKIVCQEPKSPNIKSTEIYQMCWRVLNTNFRTFQLFT